LPRKGEDGDRIKNDLFNISGSGKHSEGKKKDRFQEIEVEVVKYVTDMRRNGFPVTEESIQI